MSTEKQKGKVVIAKNLVKKSSFVDKDGREITKEQAVGKRQPLREGVAKTANGLTRKSTVL